MFVFVDDSGDPGLNFARGASTHIVMSAVVIRSQEHVARAMAAVASARYSVTPGGEELVNKREFKYNSCRPRIKDKFFDAISTTPFDLRVIILDKRTIRSDHLLENPGNIKSWLIRQMLCNTRGTVSGAKLIIDGADTRAFGGSDKTYLMRMINKHAPGTIRDVDFVDSKRSTPIQIADMTAGAVRRAIAGDEAAKQHEETFSKRFKFPTGSRWVLK